MKRLMLILLMVLLAAACVSARAETAADLTKECRLSATVDNEHRERIRDGQYEWYWTGTDGSLTVTLPEGAWKLRGTGETHGCGETLTVPCAIDDLPVWFQRA